MGLRSGKTYDNKRVAVGPRRRKSKPKPKPVVKREPPRETAAERKAKLAAQERRRKQLQDEADRRAEASRKQRVAEWERERKQLDARKKARDAQQAAFLDKLEKQRLRELEKAKEREAAKDKLRKERERKEKTSRAERERLARLRKVKLDHLGEFKPWVGSKQQGQPGIQKDIDENLKRNGLTAKSIKMKCSKKGEPIVPFAFQQVFNCLVHPRTPIERGLVKWRVGSGKTWAMLQGFQNYYFDTRPKVLIVPTAQLVRNFFAELLRYKTNAYVKFVDNRLHAKIYTKLRTGAPHAAITSGSGPKKTYLELRASQLKSWTCDDPTCKHVNHNTFVCAKCGRLERGAAKFVEELLAMRGPMLRSAGENAYMKGNLVAPLRVFSFTKAGTRLAAGDAKGRGAMPIVNQARRASKKRGEQVRVSNPYDGCVVMIDEVHNVFKPGKSQEGTANRVRLRKWLTDCRDTVLFGMTATPVANFALRERERDQLMALVKGPGSQSKNDKGYIFNFDLLHPDLFPYTSPDLTTCKCFGNTVEVPLQGENLKRYKAEAKAVKVPAPLTSAKAKALSTREVSAAVTRRLKALRKLANYCNSSGATYFQRLRHGGFEKKFQGNPHSTATKMAKIAEDVAARPQEKTLVVVHRLSSYRATLVALRYLFKQAGVRFAGFLSEADDDVYTSDDTQSALGGGERKKKSKSKSKGLYDITLKAFNNFNPVHGVKYGESAGKGQIRCLVADSQEFSEGVSFLGVQRLIIVNPPATYTEWMQVIGRPLRACTSHKTNGLPEAMQVVHIDVYVATLPDGQQSADQLALETLANEQKHVDQFMKDNFIDVAVDAGLYRMPPTYKEKVAAFERAKVQKQKQMEDRRAKTGWEGKRRKLDEQMHERNAKKTKAEHERALRAFEGSRQHMQEQMEHRKERAHKKGVFGWGNGEGLLGWGGSWKTLGLGGGGHKKSKKKSKKSKKSKKRSKKRSKRRSRRFRRRWRSK